MYDKDVAVLDGFEFAQEPKTAMSSAHSMPMRVGDYPAMPPAQPVAMPVQIIRVWTPLRVAASLLEFARSPLKSIRDAAQSSAES